MKDITLEMSLKPFRETTDEYIDSVCRMLFEQWKVLLNKVETVSVMLWSADGSELLDYKGREEEEFNWACYISDAPRKMPEKGENIWSKGGPKYMKNPPIMTYGILKKVVSSLKRVGKEILGKDKNIRVGTTFDPGPEFATSSFKYERHYEVCSGFAAGRSVMVCAYEKLNGDDYEYAAYPDGIPDGTPFGEFFGKQAKAFMGDMGFDFIWMSNGFGFGKDTWSTRGAIFDGKRFYPEKLEDTKTLVKSFWEMYKKECPGFGIEVRGTNMSTGVDLARDGVPLKFIYENNPDLLPPPNSPWAALNGDYGLELMGYMSRIARIPGDKYLFRYYLHDPWWLNSPWYDRYNSQPHDIYLPLSVARVDGKGEIMPPTNMHIFSVDNSYGDLQETCAAESLPHFLRAIKESPDMPSPIVWVYPFDEYNDAKTDQEMKEMYSEDWFIRNAINSGLPLSTITSTTDFLTQKKEIYKESILLTPVPAADSPFENAVMEYVNKGGKVIFYGNSAHSGEKFKEFFGITYAGGVSGELDVMVMGKSCGKTSHTPIISGGEITEASAESEVIATAGDRPVMLHNKNAFWLRATVSCKCRVLNDGHMNLDLYGEEEYFVSEKLTLKALSMLGYDIVIEKEPAEKAPVMMLHRNNNAFILSAFLPTTTVKAKLKFPFGAPILDAYETKLEDGYSTYNFPKSERKEIRAFVIQNEGTIKCREFPPPTYTWEARRRIEFSGLKNATIRFLGENYCKDDVTVSYNYADYHDLRGEKCDCGYVTIEGTTFFEVRNVSGYIVLNMPMKEDITKY